MEKENTSTEEGIGEDETRYIVAEKDIDPGLTQLRQKLGEKARKEPRFRFYSLYGHIHHMGTLKSAWNLIRKHGQTPGIDGMTYDIIEAKGLKPYLEEVQQQLKTKGYKPQPVRRVYIPKADGRKRPLGIPTITDRLVQMAVLLIIEPIFEADFLECSYGFRPDRSAHDAIREIVKNLKEGRISIYDADIRAYFDSIPHDKLLTCMRMRVTDGTLLKLIESWLKAPIVEKEKNDDDSWNIKVEKPSKGTAQGGVISPLLANIYLHWFDKRFHRSDGPRHYANARLVRYADDFVIMAKYVGTRVLNSAKELIENWLGLEINQEKTRVVTLKDIGDSVDFLGFTFRVEHSHYRGTYIRIKPKKKAIEKAKDKIRELTSYTRGCLPVKDFIRDINSFLKGWKGYFQLGHPNRDFRALDNYVRIKVLKHLNRRSQRNFKKPEGITWYQYLKDYLGLASLVTKT
jgi:RNA-directed DNA polymerase